jgi:hypothetical protein
VEPIEQAGALIDQVIAPFGQQPQDRGLVFAADLAQVWSKQCDLRHVKGVGGVGLAVSAGGEQPGTRRQRGGNVDDVLAAGGELLSNTAAQAAGSFYSKASLRPLLAPGDQLPESPGVNREPALSDLVAGTVDGDCGVGGLVRIDTNQDHGLPALRSLGWDVRGGHPDTGGPRRVNG